jgi:regulator of sirC expression with transglutaminase-like and TPR domain
MPRLVRCLVLAAVLQLDAPVLGFAEDPKPAPRPDKADRSVEQLAALARKSVVVVSYAGRNGQRQGVGTGFVVGTDGLIATNLHVIGEARPITVQLADGRRHEVTSVYASDRSLDLALIRIEAKGLHALELGDSAALKDGQAVVAMGNPLGLNHSVVAGVVSGRREIDGRPMIQLAIPIEPGNSGGPLLDMRGRVQGLLTLKSTVTANLGFAVPINSLKPLLKKPNPIPMSRWLTIGALDPADWVTFLGGRWKQRAGMIRVEGMGTGFGGRSLCLWQHPTPPVPYEVAVTVRLDNEAGAAGLLFRAESTDKQYGFYPSGGQLRLTRFDGPDVFSWKILKQLSSPYYRPGDWNTLKVRIEKDRFLCYVNNHLVTESTDDELTGGKVGLAKFRSTRAEFKRFQVAPKIAEIKLPPALVQRITKAVGGLTPHAAPPGDLVDALIPEGAAAMTVLRDRAKQLEQQAAQLRDLAAAVHQKQVQTELIKVLEHKEEDIDLLHAALLLARLDNDEVDVDAYRREVERMVRYVAGSLPKNADDKAKLAALNKYLFLERGFHGSRHDFYDRSNSYLNEVLDDREGLPITLSVLYIDLARRLGVKTVGLGLPSHFIVQHIPAAGEGSFIDVYEGGRTLSRADVEKLVRQVTGQAVQEEDLAPMNKKAILIRMLHNLMRASQRDLKAALRYLDTILALAPDSGQERLMRAGARYQSGDRKGSLEDVDWLLDHQPEGINLERLRDFRRTLQEGEQ